MRGIKLKRFVKVIVSTVSIILLTQSMIIAAPAPETDTPEQAGQVQQAADEMVSMLENDQYILNINQKTGQFNISCKDTGKLWWSTPPLADEDELANGRIRMEMKSNLIIQYVDMQTEEADVTNSFTASVTREQVTVQKEENRVVIAYKMLDYKLYICLLYTSKLFSVGAVYVVFYLLYHFARCRFHSFESYEF